MSVSLTMAYPISVSRMSQVSSVKRLVHFETCSTCNLSSYVVEQVSGRPPLTKENVHVIPSSPDPVAHRIIFSHCGGGDGPCLYTWRGQQHNSGHKLRHSKADSGHCDNSSKMVKRQSATESADDLHRDFSNDLDTEPAMVAPTDEVAEDALSPTTTIRRVHDEIIIENSSVSLKTMLASHIDNEEPITAIDSASSANDTQRRSEVLDTISQEQNDVSFDCRIVAFVTDATIEFGL